MSYRGGQRSAKSASKAAPAAALGAIGGGLMQFGRTLRAPFAGLLDPNYISDYGQSFLRGRPAAAAEQPQATFDRPPGGNEPLVDGLDQDGNVDRRKSDLYKQYAQTPEGQFQRYFKTSEMTPYFGSAFQGQGAPTSAQQMLDLASQTTAPTSSPLAGFYAAQSASGRGNMGEIIEALGYKGTPLEKWAQANPMLAFREYNKRFPAGQPTQGPTPALPGPPMTTTGTAGEKALQEAKFKLYEEDNASPAATVGQRTQEFLAGIGNPVVPTEDRAGTGLTQGERVALGRGVQNIQAWQMMKTQGYQSAFQPDAQSLF